jgi:hypothetical protein
MFVRPSTNNLKEIGNACYEIIFAYEFLNQLSSKYVIYFLPGRNCIGFYQRDYQNCSCTFVGDKSPGHLLCKDPEGIHIVTVTRCIPFLKLYNFFYPLIRLHAQCNCFQNLPALNAAILFPANKRQTNQPFSFHLCHSIYKYLSILVHPSTTNRLSDLSVYLCTFFIERLILYCIIHSVAAGTFAIKLQKFILRLTRLYGGIPFRI